MFATQQTTWSTIQSRFTRKKGYVEIESSEKLKHRRAIQILNSFTPQGASPQVSLRIGNWEDRLGLGYYFMEDASNARISTILVEKYEENVPRLQIPMEASYIEKIAYGSYKEIMKEDKVSAYDFVDHFGVEQASMIFYSLLTGDNIIVIHPDHLSRVQFIKSILEIVPTTFFRYNRITTGCAELDGNENIIGVEQLPKKFRSHKKLYMPLDTIFVDLNDGKIMGEGLKSNIFTTSLTRAYEKNPNVAYRSLCDFYMEISKEGFENYQLFGKNTEDLTRKIRGKLGLEDMNKDNWLMSF
ncbi:MAG: hypothetical protein ACXAE3_10285 [Candidatus Kariarchaeaceae archaeon]